MYLWREVGRGRCSGRGGERWRVSWTGGEGGRAGGRAARGGGVPCLGYPSGRPSPSRGMPHKAQWIQLHRASIRSAYGSPFPRVMRAAGAQAAWLLLYIR